MDEDILVIADEEETRENVRVRDIMNIAVDTLVDELSEHLDPPLQIFLSVTHEDSEGGRTRISSNVEDIEKIEEQLNRTLTFVVEWKNKGNGR